MTTRQQAKDVNSDPSTSVPITLSPRVDIYQNDDEFLVVSDLPGMSSSDVQVTYEDEELHLYAAPKHGSNDEIVIAGDDTVYDYARTFRVSGIDPEKISAKLENGELFLSLPKLSSSKPRRIPVERR